MMNIGRILNNDADFLDHERLKGIEDRCRLIRAFRWSSLTEKYRLAFIEGTKSQYDHQAKVSAYYKACDDITLIDLLLDESQSNPYEPNADYK